MSPTLFLVVFNELLVKLRDMGLEILAYADDLAIVGSG